MMNIALPEAADRFAVTLSMANWLITGYMVVAATTIVLAAYLRGRLGLRRVVFLGGGAMAVGCIAATLATDFPLLLGGRMVQALCTGLFFPLVTGVIMTTSPHKQLGTRLALNSGIIALGSAFGPVVSGAVLTYFGWHGLFVAPFILTVTLLVVSFFLLPHSKVSHGASIDPISVILVSLGLATLMYGLGEVMRDPAPSLAVLAIAAVVLGLFVWRQTRLKTPLLNLRPLGNPRFALGILLVMMGMMISFSLSVLLPLYFSGVAGFSSFLAGLLLLGPVLVNALLAVLGGKLFDKRGIWPLLPFGFALVLTGLAGVFLLSEHLFVALVVLSAAVSYAGLGLVVSPSKTAALSQLSSDLFAQGAAINSTLAQVASAVGPSLLVGVLSADVLKATAAGLSKADAYATGFSHTLEISIAIACVGLVVSFCFALYVRARAKRQMPPKDNESASPLL